VQTVFDADVDPGLVERSLAASTFGSMWLDIPRPGYPQATGSIICDLLVVGGGYAGLWTALHAARRNPDRRIVLIEANRIGWAASGRNGGFVDASLTHGLENGKTRWPNEIDTLEAMGTENLDGMQADIESLGLDAEWQRTGMLSVATEPHQVDWLADGAAKGNGKLLGPREVRDEVHSPTYLSGLYSPDTCAIVHPAKLALELARACREAGVCIYEHTNAHGMNSAGVALACPEPEAGCMALLNTRAGGLPRHAATLSRRHLGVADAPVRYVIVIVPPLVPPPVLAGLAPDELRTPWSGGGFRAWT